MDDDVAQPGSAKDLDQALGEGVARFKEIADMRARLREAQENANRIADSMNEHNAELLRVVEALTGISKRDDIEALLDLLAEHVEQIDEVEMSVSLFDDRFEHFFGHGLGGDTPAADDAAARVTRILQSVEKASRESDPARAMSVIAVSYLPLTRAIFEAARIDGLTADAMQRLFRFAERAREVAPIAARLAKVLEQYAEHESRLKNLVTLLEQQKPVADAFENLVSLLSKTELLAQRAEDQHRIVDDQLTSIVDEARAANLLPKPDEEDQEPDTTSGQR